MRILVLNGSPRPNGNTKKMVNAFCEGAESAGHQVDVIDVCRKKIAGCLGCDHCQKVKEGVCVQKDDMQEVYNLLKEANMLVLASPVYYHSYSGQLKCAIDRTYAIAHPGKLPNLKKIGTILSSGDDDVYEGALYELNRNFKEFLKLNVAFVKTVAKDVTDDVLDEIRDEASKLE